MPLFQRPRPPEGDREIAAPAGLGALEAALRVGDLVATEASLPQAISGVVGVAIELLGAEQGSIMLLDEDGRSLVLTAAAGLPIPARIGARLAVGESVAGRVIATGRPLHLGQVDRDQFVNFVPKSRSISSSVVVPLRAGGGCIGVLSLALSRPSAEFGQEDVGVLQIFADHAAGLIHRARMHERAERRSSDLMALVDSSRGLVGALDADTLLQRILDGGTRLAGSSKGFTCLFDPETGAILRGSFRGFEKKAIATLARSEEVRRAMETDEAVMFETAEYGTFVAVGIGRTRGVAGVLVAVADPDLVDERLELLRAFGGQCASALSAAHLHTQVLRKEKELNSIIQAVPNPIVLADGDNRIVALNWAAEQLFGTSSGFAFGAPAGEVLGSPGLVALLAREGDVTGEVVEGSPPRTYKVRVTDVRVPGAPPGRVAIMDDVTSEREIVQMQRDFVSMIGHELRTPLTIVRGFARTALRKPQELPSIARDAFETIDIRAGQLERLIEDLLYVSGIEAREASLKFERSHLASVIAQVVDEAAADHPGREVTVEAPADLEWVFDETKLALVLRHLVDNALKYSEKSRPVVVRAWVEEDELRIDVVDKGTGIVSSDLPQIFERFRQIDNSSTRHHGGTGVGLYLCQQLVRMHDGRIWVDSIWGKGSTFSVALPEAPAEDPAGVPGNVPGTADTA